MFGSVKSVLFLLLIISTELVQSDLARYARQCFGTSIFETLQRSASTVQSYLVTKRNLNETVYKIPGAEPRQIWMFIRHGARIPNAERMTELKELEDLRDEIIENFENDERNYFCESDWDKLKHWKWNENITEDLAQTITPRGEEEIRVVAQNYKRHFPELFDDVYSPVGFNFQHTDVDGARESFNVFVDTIFGHNTHLKIEAEPTEETEKLLEPYKECAAFIEQQENLDDSDTELSKFEESKTFQSVIKEVSRRLGFQKKLKSNDIMNMYDMCRYEQAWNENATCIWCMMFTPREIKVLEYAKDLTGFYEFGYGSEMNRNIQCSSVRDMVSHLEFSVDPRVTVYFGQSSSLLLHLTAMGALQDEKQLTAKSFFKQTERKWSTSKMSPFGGNFAAVRYSTKQVKFFLNEELIYFDWCRDDGVCKLADVRQKYKEMNDCDRIFCPKEEEYEESDSFFGLLLKSIF